MPIKRPHKPQTESKTTRAMQRVEQAKIVKCFGARMRYAREELCKMSQQDAARLLGYMNSSKLAKVEGATDTISIPTWLIPKAAMIYDVSIDFLFGFTDDWERDPVVSQERQIGHWLFEHWERARNAEVNAIRVLCNRLTTVERAVAHFLRRSDEQKTILDRFIELNPDYIDMRLGAKLLRFVVETVEESHGIAAELKRYHAYIEIADKTANVRLRNKDIFEGDE